jgi:hypothetical protein
VSVYTSDPTGALTLITQISCVEVCSQPVVVALRLEIVAGVAVATLLTESSWIATDSDVAGTTTFGRWRALPPTFGTMTLKETVLVGMPVGCIVGVGPGIGVV